ncbi:hypothetical protein FZC84_20980 [Rossellomorea vietnamensis]|uniref:Uncharacterized protein n=1 Tax=Rossellomorea vietnamensis TaxID=218284 RepID=A0A5D4M337_9BACI|nr:NAD(P)-dependent oxidoreductase [Rossellomorea vietnamensis]TYR95907.1 hypothetical protein FZC84_20980 [Rossellomorea vietnamensis]
MNVLLTGAFEYSNDQIKLFSDLGFKIYFVQDERVALGEQQLNFRIDEIEYVVCNSLFLYNDITCFKSLKFIQLTSAGTDRIPFDYIEQQNITLFNAKDVYSIPIAEWVLLKTLEFYKQAHFFYESQKNKIWNKNRNLLELTGKSAAIIGFGSVGNEIAKRLSSFGVEVIAVNKHNKATSSNIKEAYLVSDLEKVLKMSDIIILSLPYTKQNHHIIDNKMLSLMKANSVLVNVSRGGIIDENALVKQLDSGRFLGVALDVFEEEPLPNSNPLWECKRVSVTPHNSFVSDKVKDRLFNIILDNLREYVLKGNS